MLWTLTKSDDKSCGKTTKQPVKGAVSARDGARINVEFVLVFKRIKPMRVSRDENVNIQLSLDHREAVRVAPRHNLMTMTQTDTEAADRHHFLLRVVQVLTEHNMILFTITSSLSLKNYLLFTG